VLFLSLPVSPVESEDRVPQHDPAVLTEIARDVMRRAATGSVHDLPEPSSGAAMADEIPAVGSAPDPAPALSHIAPAREAINVYAPATASPPKPASATSDASGYRSNSWRQAPAGAARSLSFSSGAFTPSPGLDPALKVRADQLRAEGRSFVYGFLRLGAPPHGEMENKLAGLGVRLLGPHDSHQKARVPVGSIEAVAGLAKVEWLGVSLPEQKLSLELAEVRSARMSETVAEGAAVIPIVINLFEGDGDGSFRRQLEAAGAVVGDYDSGLHFYRAVATRATIDRIIAFDFVLFVELIRPTSGAHDQSTPLVDADLIRPGGAFLQRFGGAPSTLGILDTGFMMGSGGHDDLASKNGCGINFTTDAAGPFNDQHGHGTHVLGTIAGTGTADSRYRGVATGVGSNSRIRAAKIWTAANTGNSAWTESAMDFMANATECGSPAPLVINMSGGGAGMNQTGTDSTSRKLDERVWTNRQTYVIAAGNEGPGVGTVRTPGVAKNALTVGNVLDNGHLTVGDISNDSSRGPTGDNRMKPNLVAPGGTVTSARAGTTNQYRNMSGTSMATPHVTGLVATLMEHYPEFQNNPPLVRAHMMSSAIAHDDVTAMSNDYGIGRVSGYLEHWAQFDASGWSTHWSWGSVSDTNWHYRDITVPAGAQRLVVVMTWDEPAASAGASQAVTYDVDLWVDYLADCNEPTKGWCGDYRSISSIDNVEYVVVNNPPAGLYRLKASNYRAPNFALPVGIAATIIHGDPTPAMTASLTAPASVVAGATFGVTATVSTPSYVASGVQVALTSIPSGVTLLDIQTTRYDGVTTSFLGVSDRLTLGNIFPGISRSATWWYRADTTGTKSFTARAWSENGGTVTPSATTQIVAGVPDLVETAAVPSPPAPIRAPGTTFAISDTARNSGTGAAGASTTRYYLSLDGVKNAGDILLTGTRAVPGLAAGASSAGMVTVTIPPTTPLNTYSLLVCADDLNAVAESNEGNNCIVASSGTVTVTRPDLAEITVTMTPASPVGAPGTTFSVTDTTQNFGAASGPSTTRYYLSLDVTKNAGDTLLTGTRAVPGLATFVTSSGTVTVTIPSTTPLNTYFLLACADDLNVLTEINEGNNCNLAVSGTVTVTRPDLVETGATTTPAAPVRAPGTTFSVTDTARNAGAVAAGASTTRYYLSLDGVKGAGDTLLTGSRAVPGLAAGATSAGTVTVTIPTTTPPNTYSLLACADDLSGVAESNEGNNCIVASSGAVTVTRPDLRETTATTTPAAPVRAPGTTFSVTDTAQNAGAVASGASTTRYYLSLDGMKNAGDILLTGSRAVPALAAGATSSGTVTVTIPSTTPLNPYSLLACADDLNTVAETNEGNNCVVAPSGAVTVTRPDLLGDAVSNPPTTKARGATFSVTDTTRNGGAVAVGTSTTRYYLSLDGLKNSGDTLLTGSRAVPGLAAGASSSGTITVTIPSTTPLNTYVLLACADDLNTVVETTETNNCKASATGVTVSP